MNDRFFVSHTLEAHVKIEGTEFHHLAHVRRIKIHETIELVNGKGDLATARVESLEKHYALAKIEKIHHEPPPALTIVIGMALIRLERLEWAIEKGTELGAAAFHLFPSERSEKKLLTDHQMERLSLISIAAFKQCQRLYLPTIFFHDSLESALHLEAKLFFGDLHSDAAPLHRPMNEKVIGFFSGPEGGFTEEEIELLRKKATGARLHPNILRAETAPIVALSILS